MNMRKTWYEIQIGEKDDMFFLLECRKNNSGYRRGGEIHYKTRKLIIDVRYSYTKAMQLKSSLDEIGACNDIS